MYGSRISIYWSGSPVTTTGKRAFCEQGTVHWRLGREMQVQPLGKDIHKRDCVDEPGRDMLGQTVCYHGSSQGTVWMSRGGGRDTLCYRCYRGSSRGTVWKSRGETCSVRLSVTAGPPGPNPRTRYSSN